MNHASPLRVSLIFTVLLAGTLSAQTWTPIGPNTGEVYDLFFSPADSNLVYATGNLIANQPRDQLMVSEDGGASFELLYSGYLAYELAFHPTSPDTLWRLSVGGVFHSFDGGQTWDSDAPGGPSTPDYLLRPPGDQPTLYANDSFYNDRSLIYRSDDNGINWTLVYDTNSDLYEAMSALFTRPGNPDTLYTTRQIDPSGEHDGTAIWRSADGGETWESMASIMPWVTHYDLLPEIYFHPDDLSRVYATGVLPQGQFGMVSYDGGASFALLTGPWGGPEFATPRVLDDGRILVTTPENMYVSDNLGVTWDTALADPDVYPLAMYDFLGVENLHISPYAASHLYITYEDILLRSMDAGATWSAGVQGFNGSSVKQIESTLADPDVVHSTTEGGVFRTDDRGATWDIVSISPASFSQISPYDADVALRWEYSSPWITHDGGETWLECEELGNTVDFAFDPNDSDIVLCIANPPGIIPGVFRSTDGGETWTRSDGFDWYTGQIAFDPLTAGRVLLLDRDRIYESFDDGATFSLLHELDDDAVMFSLEPDGPGILVLASYEGQRYGLFSSDRNELEFVELPPLSFNTDHVDLAPDGWMVNSSAGRVDISPDLGETWWTIVEPADVPPTIYRTTGITSDGTLYVAGGGDGTLMGTNALGVGDSGSRDHSLPGSFTLHPVYPNPFNGSATITFELPRPESVTVTVVDLLGRQAAVLVSDHTFSAGTHQLGWTADNLASGSYFVRLRGNNLSSATRRVTLIK